MKPVAIVQHDIHDGPSYFATWLQRQGIGYTVFEMFSGGTLPTDHSDFSGLCMLGGPMSANDALPYYPHLLQLVRSAVQRRQPVIGHCLGGQLLSRALGGTVQASAHAEVGWSQLEAVHADASAWFGGTSVQLFQWHGESFSIPPGAAQLLTSRYCANQAYVVDGLHLGMQFHCEVDLPKLHCWLELGAQEMRTSTSPGVQKPEAILQTLEADLARSQRTADHIYRRWAQGLLR